MRKSTGCRRYDQAAKPLPPGGSMGERMDGRGWIWMGGWVGDWMGGWLGGWVNGWGGVNGWVGGPMSEWVGRWENG